MRELEAAGQRAVHRGRRAVAAPADGRFTGVEVKGADGTRPRARRPSSCWCSSACSPSSGPIAEWGLELDKRALEGRHREVPDEHPGHLRGRRHQHLSGQEEADPVGLPRGGARRVRRRSTTSTRRRSSSCSTRPRARSMQKRLGVPAADRSGQAPAWTRASPICCSCCELERLEVNLFRGESRDIGSPQVFGGQVLGQALRAAYATVDGPHGAFAARVLPAARRLQRADRLRGRPQPRRPQLLAAAASWRSSTASRSSTCRRRSRLPEPGLEHQIPMPEVPPPEALPDLRDVIEAQHAPLPSGSASGSRARPPFEFRHVQPLDYLQPKREEPRPARVVPHRGPLCRTTTRCIAACWPTPPTSTCSARRCCRTAAPWPVRHASIASIDHAMWFHRPVRVDDWLLYSIDSPSASGARGFARGSIYARDGRLVASTAQEGLLRVSAGSSRQPSRARAAPGSCLGCWIISK